MTRIQISPKERKTLYLSTYVQYLKAELIANQQIRAAGAYQGVVNNIQTLNQGKDILVQDIDASLIKGFEDYLREKGSAPNTISFYMRNLRAIYNKAVIDGIIKKSRKNPFQDVYTAVLAKKKRQVMTEEIRRRLGELDLLAPTPEELSEGTCEFGEPQC